MVTEVIGDQSRLNSGLILRGRERAGDEVLKKTKCVSITFLKMAKSEEPSIL